MSQGLVFGRFEVRLAQRQLLADGQPLSIGARAFDVLATLVERRERVVTKNELLDQAWPGLVVEENNLSVQISALRKALGAQSIATVTGRGYRFVLPERDSATAATAATAPETPGRIARRLAAVVCAEVVDWHLAVERHGEVAVAAWRSIRSELIEAAVPMHGGRVHELAAESVWLEFASAVDALRWALDLQQRFTEYARRGAVALRMRLGIHVDDLIVDDGKLIGQSARWAAQWLRAAGQRDAIVVSDTVRGFVEQRLPVRLRPLDGGAVHPQSGLPVALYAVEPGSAVRPKADPQQPSWVGKPAVAVLPFATDGGDAPYFGDGITEEIVSALSLNRALLVIARNSTLRYRDSTKAPDTIAAELGVRYLLSGSVRRHERRLRIGVELIDAADGRAIWTERYDGADEDLFGFQSKIASAIAAAIDPRVQEAEIARVATRPTESLSAYDCVLRGLAVQHTFRDPDLDFAGEMFRRAIELDPNYAQAHAHLAWWHNLRFGEGRSPELSEDGRAAERLSMRAVELDPRDAWVLSVAGHVQGFVKKRLNVAMEMFEQALTLNPSCAAAWALSAIAQNFLGDGEEGAQRVRTAMRLSPFDPQTFAFVTARGTAEFVQGHYDEAVAWYGKARRLNPGYRAAHRMLVAALAQAGDLVEAREQATAFVAVEPSFRADTFGQWYPMREPHLSRVIDGMRQAGLAG